MKLNEYDKEMLEKIYYILKLDGHKELVRQLNMIIRKLKRDD